MQVFPVKCGFSSNRVSELIGATLCLKFGLPNVLVRTCDCSYTPIKRERAEAETDRKTETKRQKNRRQRNRRETDRQTDRY